MADGRRAAGRAATPTRRDGHAGTRDPLPRRHVRVPARPAPVLDGFDLTIPAGTSLAIVGVNGAGKTTLAKLLCRLYDPQQGSIEIDGVDLRDARHRRVARPRHRGVPGLRALRAHRCATTSRHAARPTPSIAAALARRGRRRPRRPRHGARQGVRGRHRPLRRAVAARRAGTRAVPRCASARACVLLDEPTAQLDVRGEAEIFARVLAATQSHHDDPRLAPLLDRAPGRPHLRGRPRPRRRARHARRADGAGAAATTTMFDLQASRFSETWSSTSTARRCVHDTLA